MKIIETISLTPFVICFLAFLIGTDKQAGRFEVGFIVKPPLAFLAVGNLSIICVINIDTFSITVIVIITGG